MKGVSLCRQGLLVEATLVATAQQPEKNKSHYISLKNGIAMKQEERVRTLMISN
jgi:hypothetical protein